MPCRDNMFLIEAVRCCALATVNNARRTQNILLIPEYLREGFMPGLVVFFMNCRFVPSLALACHASELIPMTLGSAESDFADDPSHKVSNRNENQTQNDKYVEAYGGC